mmetsp:Transcript_30419/g.67278  ORF Transcript_30419/g.67278 Transcript_30419/m.67278 type:complete len:283 (+) Transcript_30419:2058-2906(+)
MRSLLHLPLQAVLQLLAGGAQHSLPLLDVAPAGLRLHHLRCALADTPAQVVPIRLELRHRPFQLRGLCPCPLQRASLRGELLPLRAQLRLQPCQFVRRRLADCLHGAEALGGAGGVALMLLQHVLRLLHRLDELLLRVLQLLDLRVLGLEVGLTLPYHLLHLALFPSQVLPLLLEQRQSLSLLLVHFLVLLQLLASLFILRSTTLHQPGSSVLCGDLRVQVLDALLRVLLLLVQLRQVLRSCAQGPLPRHQRLLHLGHLGASRTALPAQLRHLRSCGLQVAL